MRLFGKVDGSINRLDRVAFCHPFSLFDLAYRPATVDGPSEGIGSIFPPIYTRPSPLTLLAYTEAGGVLVGDWTLARGVNFETGEHGFGLLTGFVPATDWEAFAFYRSDSPYHLVLTDGVAEIFSGRVEDVGIQPGGFSFSSYGYWRAMSDVLYSALWVDSSTANWNVLNDDHIAGAIPDRYTTDNNNRLYMAPNKDETYSSSTAFAFFGYSIPQDSLRQIVRVEFSYTLKAPSGWRARLDRRSSSWGLSSSVWTLDGNGGTQTGTQTLTVTATDRLSFTLFYNAASAAFTGETGDTYLRITNLKVKTFSGDVTPGLIVKDLIDHVSGINPSQLSPGYDRVTESGLDLDSEVYEDLTPADILTGLTRLGDDQSPPNPYAAAVWEERELAFGPLWANGRTWYIDADQVIVERSLDGAYNSVYATYSGPQGSTGRTAAAVSQSSIELTGITRQRAVRVNTSSAAFAEAVRDLELEAGRRSMVRADIKTFGVYNEAGARYPLYSVRAGDTMIIRNLPPDTYPEIDKIRSFRVMSTRYDCDRDELTPVPDAGLNTIEIVLSRHEKGL